jgi:mRNA interferase MazF
LKRGEIWTVSGGGAYTGKPRPALIVQDDIFASLASVVVCAFTTDTAEAPILRPVVEPDEANGLKVRCRPMIDKITAVPKSKLGKRIGKLDADTMVLINRAMAVFLGLAQARS